MENVNLPNSPKIGPHDGRELDLMLAGEKPMAMFYAPIDEAHVIPEAAFAPHVRDGVLVQAERHFHIAREAAGDPEIRIVLYALPTEEWRIAAALAIIEPVWHGDRPPAAEDDIEMGRLLGYSDAEIAAFLEVQEALILAP
jgi:hypothetical protein